MSISEMAKVPESILLAARDSMAVNVYVNMIRYGRMSFEEAMVALALCLATENDRLMKYMVSSEALRPVEIHVCECSRKRGP